MDWLLQWLGVEPSAVGTGERLLAYIITLIAAIFLIAVAFALLVLLLRARHVRQRHRSEALSARWHDVLLDVLNGAAPLASFQERVDRGTEREALWFLMQFARRLRGDEARVLVAIAQPYLPQALHEARHPSPERRAFGVQALAAFGMPEHTDVVLNALDDVSPYVAMTAAQALARPEHAHHAPNVMRRLWRFVHWSGDYLSAMLARVGPAAARPAIDILGDADQPANARAVAADVLRRLNEARAGDTAAAVLASPAESARTPAVQASALRLLAQVGHGNHLRDVLPFVTSSNGLVRAAAMQAVSALGSASEVAILTRGLRDASQFVARHAARGLLRMGRADVLEQAAADADVAALVARQALAESAVP